MSITPTPALFAGSPGVAGNLMNPSMQLQCFAPPGQHQQPHHQQYRFSHNVPPQSQATTACKYAYSIQYYSHLPEPLPSPPYTALPLPTPPFSSSLRGQFFSTQSHPHQPTDPMCKPTIDKQTDSGSSEAMASVLLQLQDPIVREAQPHPRSLCSMELKSGVARTTDCTSRAAAGVVEPQQRPVCTAVSDSVDIRPSRAPSASQPPTHVQSTNNNCQHAHIPLPYPAPAYAQSQRCGIGPLIHQWPTSWPYLSLGTQDMAGRSNSCHLCGKTYARQSTLRTHMKSHNGEKPYQCSICQKSFTQAANLTAHLRTHSGEKPFKCPVCHRGFSQSSSVTTHMRTHSGDRPYKCNVCSKGFADSSTLTKHYRTHTGEKPYQCKICEARFSQSGNLNRHMKTHRTSIMGP